nr:hypothetical protein [uncultured Roseococcus sp.]
MLRSGFWLLLLGLLGACALPVNTALRDWTRSAETALDRSGAAPASLAAREALATYFQALGALWDGADLSFDAARFATLAAAQPDPAVAGAIRELGRLLRAASDEKPPRWLPADNSGPTPAYEDRRLSTTIRAADPSVQFLLAALNRPAVPAAATPMPPPAATDDPALQQVQLEQEARRARRAAQEQTAQNRQAAVLAELAAGHALLAGLAGRLRQRETERELRRAEDRLRRAMADRGALQPPGAEILP